jgi:hypothetical protein
MDLCITPRAMAKSEKKTDLTSFRLSQEFREAVRFLAQAHKAKSMSDYFRGLIYMDALLSGLGTDTLDKPGWVTRDYGKFLKEMEKRNEESVRPLPGTETPEYQAVIRRLESKKPEDKQFQAEFIKGFMKSKRGRKAS